MLDDKDDGAALHELERFVSDVVSSEEMAFEKVIEENVGRASLKKLPLSKYLASVSRFISLYLQGVKFEERESLFFDACKDLKILEGDHIGRSAALLLGRPDFSSALLFNEVVDFIRKNVETDIKIRCKQQKRAAERNFLKVKRYVQRLFERHARLLVLRVDLSYLKEVAGTVTARMVQQDLRRFLNNTRSNRLFDNMVGYIWKLELGAKKRYHLHCIFFYDGSRSCQDTYLANEIGGYWKKITLGRGIYFNCNAKKEAYRRLGIGMIHHADGSKRKILVDDAISYMMKSDQYFKVSVGDKGKTFGTSELRPARSGAGRPRNTEEICTL
jgi:hypothetical protein